MSKARRQLSPDAESVAAVERCALCVIGGGYAGINALDAASQYLPKGATVVVIDRNDTWGGHWLKQYEHVRLHQPHRLFTAGEKKWAMDKDPNHLASRREVVSHLADCAMIARKHLNVVTLFGYDYAGYKIVDGKVELTTSTFKSTWDDSVEAAPVRVIADKLLNAIGFDIKLKKPMKFATEKVRSMSVCDLGTMLPSIKYDPSPIYIIGGGKTAMDTAKAIIKAHPAGTPAKKLVMVYGRGTYFVKRDKMFPTTTYGRCMPWTTDMVTPFMIKMALQYDGTNEKEVQANNCGPDGYFHSAVDNPQSCMLGIIGIEEMATIKAGVSTWVRGHCDGIEETADGQLAMKVLDSGAKKMINIEPNAIIVNCTGHLEDSHSAPMLQDGGLVFDPQRFMVFTGPGCYFGTHLWFLGKLEKFAPKFKRIEWSQEPKGKVVFEAFSQFVYNFMLVFYTIPLGVAMGFEGNYDKFYPLYRQMGAMMYIVRKRGKVLRHVARTLPLTYDGAQNEWNPAGHTGTNTDGNQVVKLRKAGKATPYEDEGDEGGQQQQQQQRGAFADPMDLTGTGDVPLLGLADDMAGASLMEV